MHVLVHKFKKNILSILFDILVRITKQNKPAAAAPCRMMYRA